MVALQHPRRIWEGVLVPCKVAPVIALHPETVKVKYMQRNIPLRHAVNERRSGRFIIIGGKGCGQPKAEAPRRRQRGTACQRRIQVKRLLRCTAADHIIDQRLALHRELHALHLLAGYLKAHVGGILHQHAIAAIGHIEGNILVCLFAARAAVGVPHVDGLPILHIRGKALTQAIHTLAHVQHQGFRHIGLAGVFVLGMTHAVILAAGQQLLTVIVIHAPLLRALAHMCRKAAAPEYDFFFCFRDFRLHLFLIGFKPWLLRPRNVSPAHE